MQGTLRLLIVWLLVLALPAQGVAAAAMQWCGAAHGQQTRLLERVVHEHAGGQPAHGAHAHAAGQGAERAPVEAQARPTPIDKQACSACAACCMATALAPSLPSLPVVEPAIDRTALVVPSYAGPDAAGLERPPRQSRA